MSKCLIIISETKYITINVSHNYVVMTKQICDYYKCGHPTDVQHLINEL